MYVLVHLMSNTKILKNALLLNVRLLFTLTLGLFATRIVINALGVVDYGVYGVVVGLVTTFGFMSVAMSSSTQRYLSFYLGLQHTKWLQLTFSAAVNIHALIGLISFFLAESVGLWAVNYLLDIPEDRISAANTIYQFSLISFVCGIMQVPYLAAIIAYEKMNAYAYISIAEAALKLGSAYLLFVGPLDRLILYSQLLALISFLSFLSYFIYVQLNFKEIKYLKYFDRKYYTEILSFSGWNLFGNIAAVARSQGINVLMNIFFGVALNAAFAVVLMVQGALTQFAAGVQQAINPQIIKSYAKDDKERTAQLMYFSSKYSFFIMLILVAPIYLNVDFVLGLWLGVVPEFTSLFVGYVFLLILIDVLSNSLMVGLQATGRIKMYHITVGIMVFLNFPITLVAFKFYSDPSVAFEIMIFISIISLFARLCFVKVQMGYAIRTFFEKVIARVVLVTAAFLLPLWVLREFNFYNDLLKFSVDLVFCTFSLILIIYLVGMAKGERLYLNRVLKKKLIYGAD